MNCLECKHRRSIPGDCHSECVHPSTQDIKNNNILAIVALLKAIGPEDTVVYAAMAKGALNIDINPHGIKNGWALWPFNFDPVWLNNCEGFEER